MTFTTLRNTSRPSSRSFFAGSRRCGAAARRTLKGTTVWISSIARNCSSLIVCAIPSHVYPALLTTMSSCPNSVDGLLDERLADAVLREVAAEDGRVAVDRRCGLGREVPSRSFTSTRAPCAERSSAVARPIPRAEPVTIAALPSRAFMRSLPPGSPPRRLVATL